ncbi:hypothetical protein ID866_3289 [Astraeus odoratus]|nr:hypothetical protein ID866_3289 [Astraeus odoratus]
MPPVPTRSKLKHKSSRRDEEFAFDGSHAREIEQKRNSGQISCAECRRFVLAATEHLHRQITRMSERIRQLEDALGELHSRHSTELHPLLRPDLIGATVRGDGPDSTDNPTSSVHPPELLEALGTLSIAEGETPRFFGPTAGSHADEVPSTEAADSSASGSVRDSMSPELPNEISALSQAFPFNSTSSISAWNLKRYLPSQDRATYLAETYLEQAGWLFRSVTKDQVMKELLPLYYSNGIANLSKEETNPHKLGLVFLIFAIGALVDLQQVPQNAEAEHFHQLARAAICVQSVMEKPSLETIQALHLLSIYNAVSGNELSGKETSMETSWSLVTLAAHLSHTIGLHRDSERWILDATIVERRRVLFWDLFVADAWNSLDTGRPMTFSTSYTNCKFPRSALVNDRGEVDKQVFYESWAMRFASDYPTIMELHRRVHEFPVPEPAAEFAAAASGAVPSKPADRDIGVAESMGRFVMSNAREVILLYIHRSYFAQAIIENPVNPLKSVYTPSFLAAYRASLTILHTVKAQFNTHESLTARFWPVWTFLFSATVVFGTIVTRGPRSPMATSAMKELNDACLLLSKAAKQSRRAQKALPIVSRLNEKARSALVLAQTEMPYELGQQWSVENANDELAIFAGRTKFVSLKRPTTDSTSDRSPRSDESINQDSSPGPEQPLVEKSASYSSEVVGSSAWSHPDTAMTAEPARAMPSWEQGHYQYTSSQSTLLPVLPPLQHPVHAQTQAQGPIPGPSSRPWHSDSAHPYRLANLSASGGHSQAFHPHQQRYDEHPHCSPASSVLASTSYYDDGLGSAGHQSQHTHQPPHQHHPPAQHHPSIPLAPPELTQLGLVAQESRLDQRWTSFMRESGYFEEFQYKTG